MVTVLFYAMLLGNTAPVAGTQEFADKAACEAAVDALRDNFGKTAAGFCTAKGTEDDAPTPSVTPTPTPAPSGSTVVKAPVARK